MSNREHLYRGFAPDENGSETVHINGKEIRGRWVYGSLVSIDDPPTIWSDNHVATPVIPETVGEWTGLEDQESNRIFEDDIMISDDDRFVVVFGRCGGVKNCEAYGYIGFYLSPASINTDRNMRFGKRDDIVYWLDKSYGDALMAGNCWENPELLEV